MLSCRALETQILPSGICVRRSHGSRRTLAPLVETPLLSQFGANRPVRLRWYVSHPEEEAHRKKKKSKKIYPHGILATAERHMCTNLDAPSLGPTVDDLRWTY